VYRAEISAFLPNLVAMATPLAPLKILIAYLISLTPKTLLFTGRMSISSAELKSVQFWLIFAQVWMP